MATYTQIFYHIVFSTKNRERTLDASRREDLFRYIWGIAKNKDCHLYRIGGVEDHIHIFSSLHPTVALADFVKDIKVATTKWIKDSAVFKTFENWQEGYGAFTHSATDKDALIEYVKNQPEHHRQKNFTEELRELLARHGVNYDEKYFV